MSTWKRAFVFYCLLFACNKLIFVGLKWNAEGYHKAHLWRLAQVVDINFFMLLGSVFAWARIKALFQDDSASPASSSAVVVGGAGVVEFLSHGSNKKLKSSINGDRRLSTSATNAATEKWKFLAGLCFFAFSVCNHLAYFLYYFVNDVEPSWLAWTCLCCVGVWTHLIVFLFGFSVGNFVLRLVQAFHWGREALKPIYKVPLLKSLATDAKRQTVTALILTLLFSAFSIYAGSRPRVNRVEVRLTNLPRQFDGFKIILLTDMHVGPSVGRTLVERVVNLTNKEAPDVVAIAGDLVDGTVDDLGPAVEPLKNLVSKYGVFFSTGNHEMYYGRVDDWFVLLKSLNVKVLHNENKKILIDKASICFAGVDDVYSNYLQLEGHKMDFEKALNSCDSKMTKILLAHNPKGAKLAADSNPNIDLILSGHTHAGQMYVLAPLMYLLAPYFYGLHVHSSGFTQIYVSSGVYYWGAPMKMFGYAEIALITLRRR